MLNFTRGNVTNWMRSNWEAHMDNTCFELNMTSLVEAAADNWNRADQPGPLDDDTHWIWDCATAIDEDIVANAREIMQEGESEVGFDEVMYGNKS